MRSRVFHLRLEGGLVRSCLRRLVRVSMHGKLFQLSEAKLENVCQECCVVIWHKNYPEIRFQCCHRHRCRYHLTHYPSRYFFIAVVVVVNIIVIIKLLCVFLAQRQRHD